MAHQNNYHFKIEYTEILIIEKSYISFQSPVCEICCVLYTLELTCAVSSHHMWLVANGSARAPLLLLTKRKS